MNSYGNKRFVLASIKMAVNLFYYEVISSDKVFIVKICSPIGLVRVAIASQ